MLSPTARLEAVPWSILAKADVTSTCSLIAWTFIWIARYRKQDPTALQDAFICLLVELWVICTNTSGKLEDLPETIVLYAHILLAISGWLIYSYVNYDSRIKKKSRVAALDIKSTRWARPLVFPSRTTHSRFFPQKHSFSYTYLLVGIPVGWQGSINRFLSVDSSSSRSILSVHASDYLDRDSCNCGLREKLDIFLESQKIQPQRYPHAYLVTAPRVFGYSFNPASFWYLYDTNHELRAMIVEVNNTFDERRVYFLQPEDKYSLDLDAKFTSKWAKDFHVSPFNSRDGLYTLVAQDPAPSSSTKENIIANTITLISPENKPKLVARIFSTQEPIDPAKLNAFGALRILFRFGWVGFLTFPRILSEARKLYFWKGLSVWYRPEVGKESIGRQPTSTERILEKFFRQYLQYAVESSETPICLIYKAAPSIQQEHVQRLGSKSSHHPMVEMQIISPAFYSRFVHYAHTAEAFDSEGICTDEKNRLLYISRPDILGHVFTRNDSTKVSPRISSYGSFSMNFDCIRWRMVRNTRCPPAQQSYQVATSINSNRRHDIRQLPFSQMDTFVMRHSCEAWLYRRQLFRLFMAQRFVFGFEAVLGLLDWLWRFTLMWVGLVWTRHLCRTAEPEVRDLADLSPLVQMFLTNATHIWSALKGL